MAELEVGLTSRATIDHAKGVVMVLFDLDADAAFDVLRWVSQHANIKVAVIAERFLAEVRHVDLSSGPREQVTLVLDALARSSTWSGSSVTP